MPVVVKTGKVQHGDKVFKVGDSLDELTKDEQKALVDAGVAEEKKQQQQEKK